MGRLVNTTFKRDYLMLWRTQAGDITTNLNADVVFTLPELSTSIDVTWIYHSDDSAKGRYNMILGMDI